MAVAAEPRCPGAQQRFLQAAEGEESREPVWPAARWNLGSRPGRALRTIDPSSAPPVRRPATVPEVQASAQPKALRPPSGRQVIRLAWRGGAATPDHPTRAVRGWQLSPTAGPTTRALTTGELTMDGQPEETAGLAAGGDRVRRPDRQPAKYHAPRRRESALHRAVPVADRGRRRARRPILDLRTRRGRPFGVAARGRSRTTKAERQTGSLPRGREMGESSSVIAPLVE